MKDCLIVGFNEQNFEDYLKIVRSMGENSGAYRDINLAFIEYNNKPYRALEILTHFYYQGKSENIWPFRNTDFLSPTILYLVTYLSKRGLSSDYVNLFQLEKDKLREKLERNDILAVVIPTTLYVSPHPILEIISFIKQHNDSAKIIIGGPYVLNQSIMLDKPTLQSVFNYIGADIYVINQEGELALVNILKALKNGLSLENIDNIAYKNGEDYIINSNSAELNPLEENMPDYSMFPRYEIGEFLSLTNSRSCPFSCSYCGYSQRAGKYRYLPVDCVEKQLDTIRDVHNVTTLTFFDDTFNVPKERFKEILQMMIRNKYDLRWNSYYRCDYGDDEVIGLMKEAGCEGVFLGMESGCDAILKNMGKKVRRKDYLKAIPLLKEVGITTHCNLIVGFPGETHDTVQETVELIEETRPDFFRAQLWYCDPITPIWQKREEYGIEGSAFNWSHNTMDYKAALDLLEEKYFINESSTWLPQNGFEVWSIFYLQRRGMSLGQIKTFLKCFYAVAKEKLLRPNKTDTNFVLLENLRRSCKFDSPGETQNISIKPATDEELAMLGYYSSHY